ncbi:MAG: hypothetical protein B1H40_01470 [Candidatus Latescibacteria bacterium 4484_181]|nr:MAG: hypothetical protein B1H40_01470 [Candidatus Latescibacteria bacterium 4484_181]RKY69621.1 MAG: hypothetical protein DRQ02_00445 [Candidatus Latescibacterota bacterium]RKY73923.1 MAG: hypothetical protein DRQ24_01145 [Candidatus Latescibacterota bacterium]
MVNVVNFVFKKYEGGRMQLRLFASLFMCRRKSAEVVSRWRSISVLGIVLVALFWVGCKQPTPKPQKEVMPIRVEVLNGCEERGLARRLTDLLRRSGFDVVNFGNAESFDFLETIVVDRSGHIERARRVARALGVKNCIQQIKQDPYRIEDVLVIIGRDFRNLPFFKDIGR